MPLREKKSKSTARIWLTRCYYKPDQIVTTVARAKLTYRVGVLSDFACLSLLLGLHLPRETYDEQILGTKRMIAHPSYDVQVLPMLTGSHRAHELRIERTEKENVIIVAGRSRKRIAPSSNLFYTHFCTSKRTAPC